MRISRRDRRDSRGGFTLIELLVVVGIIAIMTAMALPAINKFLKGQKLNQAGRLIQSAFNEARRAAITQRARHWVFLCRKNGTGGNPDTISLFSYRENKGWETTEIQLPASIVPVYDADPVFPAIGPAPTGPTALVRGSKLPVIDITAGLPASNQTPFFDPTQLKPVPTGTFGAFEFRRDGTLTAIGSCQPQGVPSAYPQLYDLNTNVPWVPATTAADIVLRQAGEPSKLCFISVDINTGRVRFRVVETDTAFNTGGTG